MGTSAEPAELFAEGARIHDRYEIVNEIAVGSFGRIYRARQLSTGQDVALKILRVRDGDTPVDLENQRQRFRREMQLCATLTHPNIVRLVDSGDVGDGRVYAVFEYVPGTTLREVIDREGRLEPAEALHLMTQVLDALACAHAQGIVHRDLKPENVMITRTGVRRNATVLDFGLGGFSGVAPPEAIRLTATREFMGTPSYAAPEQIRGEPPTPRSDLYSWGLIFLECLTGALAVAARTPHEAVMKQIGPAPVPIPPWLREQRLGRLLAAVTVKDPAARDMSESALLEAVESIQRSGGPVATSEERRPPVTEGERRQVTVVVCATTVARVDGRPVDLEDLDHAMQAQQQLYEEVVHQGGQTLMYGDAGEVHVVFGYPKAHENDARRAVRMALRILERSRAANAAVDPPKRLGVTVRVGIHSGLGIVRVRYAGSDAELQVQIVGAPATVATRLADRAGADEILATAETRALLREEMECAPAGEVSVPDRVAPLAVFRVLAERPIAALESSVRPEETPLVGRGGEVAQLMQLWSRAEGGQLGVVLLQGEAGIGKSRLVREIRRVVPSGACIACRCAPEGRGTPLHPIVACLRALPGPLDRLLADHGFDVAATWPLVADLLEVPRGDYEPLRLSPERQKELTLRALVGLVLRMARRKALLFILEDLHWADPTTGEFIALLIDEARTLHLTADPSRSGLMILFSARPEYVAGWATQDVTVLPLARLGRGDVAAIVNAGRPPDQALSDATIDGIVARTDGVPLFVEELAHALALGEESAIPSSLRELLTARLDALSSSTYETAQFAAAIGREVPYPLLRAVIGKDEWVIRQDLLELVDTRLLFVRRGAGEEAYVFRHALVRDAAYESMVRVTRRRVHQAIAATLRAEFPLAGEQEPERLARHLEEAGDLAAAAEHWYRAGDRAFRRAAYVEATAHLERSLAALETLPETPDRVRQEIEALTVLGTVCLYTTGHSDPRGREAFARAQALCETHRIDLSLKIIAHLSGVYIIQGNREALQTLLPQCERLVQSSEPVARLTGIVAVGLDAFWRGDHRRARELFDLGMPLYRMDVFREYAETYGWDGGIYVPLYAVWNAAVIGEPASAGVAMLAAAAASFDPQAPALVHVFAMAAAHVRRDVATARAHAEQAIAISGEQRFFGLLLLGMCGRGLALVREGSVAAGIAELTNALEMLRAGGAHSPRAYYLTYLAEAHLAAGDAARGLALTGEALARCADELARVQEPELLRLEGELLGLTGDDAAAEPRLRRAVALAAERGAAVWELRAAVALGRLLRGRGRDAEAREIVRAAHDRFPATATTADLLAARALLAGA